MLAPAAVFLIALLGVLIGPSPRTSRDSRTAGRQEQVPAAKSLTADKLRIALHSSRLEDKTLYDITFDLEGEGKLLHRAELAVFAGQWATVSVGDFKEMSLFCDAPSGFGPMLEKDPEPRPREFQVARSAWIVTAKAEEPRDDRSKVSVRVYRFDDMALVQASRKNLVIPLGAEMAVDLK